MLLEPNVFSTFFQDVDNLISQQLQIAELKHLTYRHNKAARMGTASLPEDFVGQDIVDSRKCCPEN
ncbi:hypothetical protein KIH23_13230 [Flavobacterium sp. CYK-55]|uniref:hypothetical protein n=1 Tax=Flavobacterium sp. CYK-55 TaxID=2835529 RepID=UPI001BCA9FDE|nr:hypothetical protein [Flavobacterium sp. CYK-55]MBS7788264.1 hypothetical protein [Flavobacterium sp. CYK-55]